MTKLKNVIDNKYWCIIKNFYEQSEGKLKYCGYSEEQPFKIDKGVKQGGILSPFLFNF